MENFVYVTKYGKTEERTLIEHARTMLANCEIHETHFCGLECGICFVLLSRVWTRLSVAAGEE